MELTKNHRRSIPAGFWPGLILFIFSIVVGTFFIYLSQTSIEKILSIFVDDAFYYLKIAQNIALGKGFTFDGVNPTNGFQPLWQFILVPFYLVFKGNITPIRAVIVFSGILHVVTGWLIYKVSQRLIGRWWGLLTAIIWLSNPHVLSSNYQGMETVLSAFIFVLLIDLFTKTAVKNLRGNNLLPFVWGLMVGLFALTRTEYAPLIFFVALYVITLSLKTDTFLTRNTFFRLLILSDGFLLVFGTYAIWSLIKFHTLASTGGLAKLYYTYGTDWYKTVFSLKFLPEAGRQLIFYSRWLFDSVFGHFSRQAFTYLHFPHYNLIFGLLIIAVFVWSINYRTYWHLSRRFLLPLLTFGIFVVSHFIFISIIFHRYVNGKLWYFPIEYISLIFLGVFTLRSLYMEDLRPLFAKFRIGAYFLLVVSVIFFSLVLKTEIVNYRHLLAVEVVAQKDYNDQFYLASQWLNDNVSTDKVVGAFSSGILGYFSHQRVINLDGFANSPSYLKLLKENRFREFVDQSNITYFADIFLDDPSQVGISWGGEIPAINLTQVAFWPRSPSWSYWILQYQKDPPKS